jgi:hypothetical protein
MILLPAISEDKRQLVSGPGERPSPSSVCWTKAAWKARSVASSARHGTTPSQCLSFTGIKLVYYILVHAGFSSDRAWVHCGGDEKQRAPEFLILLALVWYGGMRKWYGCGLIYSPPRLTPNPTKALPRVRDSLAPHLRADGASGAQLRMCDGEGGDSGHRGGQRTQVCVAPGGAGGDLILESRVVYGMWSARPLLISQLCVVDCLKSSLPVNDKH